MILKTFEAPILCPTLKYKEDDLLADGLSLRLLPCFINLFFWGVVVIALHNVSNVEVSLPLLP
jgi:hypothetical protein